MKIGYFGTPQHSADFLQKLIDAGYEISFAVTNEDKPVGRKKILTPSPVKEMAIKNIFNLLQFPSIKVDCAFEQFYSTDADIYIIYAYGKLIPREIFNKPGLGTLNLHGSILPLLRGASPVQSALLQNFKSTGVSLQYIVEELDAGDIIGILEFDILDSDTTATLFNKITQSGFELLDELLKTNSDSKFNATPQDHLLATYCKKLTNEDRKIDFTRKTIDVFNQIRAFNPPPYAHAIFRGKRMNIIRSEIFQSDEYTTKEPGEIIIVDKKQFAINCGDGLLLIKELQLEGKNIMKDSEFMNGYRILEGEKVI